MAKSKTSPLAAVVNITRRSWEDEHGIEIVIKLGTGRTITAELSAEDFALALTGRSEIPAGLKLRNVDIVMAGSDGAEM